MASRRILEAKIKVSASWRPWGEFSSKIVQGMDILVAGLREARCVACEEKQGLDRGLLPPWSLGNWHRYPHVLLGRN